LDKDVCRVWSLWKLYRLLLGHPGVRNFEPHPPFTYSRLAVLHHLQGVSDGDVGSQPLTQQFSCPVTENHLPNPQIEFFFYPSSMSEG